MNTSYLIKNAILSEKAYKQMETGVYTFFVDDSSTKESVKLMVEKHFAVSVKKVNVTRQKAKSKRIAKTRKSTMVGGAKKAIVYLKAGQSIASLLPKAETKSSKKSSKTESKEQSSEDTKKFNEAKNKQDLKPKGGLLSSFRKTNIAQKKGGSE